MVIVPQATEQPTAYLKEVLAEICLLNKQGPARGTYELKPEYAGREAAAAGPAPQ